MVAQAAMLPTAYKVKHHVIHYDLCHTSDVLRKEHFANIFWVMVSGDEVSNTVISCGDSDQDWLELEHTNMVKKFSQAVLELWV